MRSGSTGIPAASLSKLIKPNRRRAGFTLIEALVSLSLLLAFAATLGPLVFHGHRILVHGDGQVQAELLLRSLLQTPFDRADPELGIRAGENGALRWRVDVEPMPGDILPPEPPPSTKKADVTKDGKAKKQPKWALYQVTAAVSWGSGRIVKAETLQLGAIE